MQIQSLTLPEALQLRKRLFNTQETAQYLGRSVNAVRELQWAGRLPFVQEGRRVFFDILDLDKWINEHKRKELGI